MGHRLLVVDNDRRFLQDHKASLESAFEVDFRDGTEGSLTHLETGDYAAILLCVEASENKGYSLCSAIRRSPVLADLKVALISAKATEEEYARHQSLKGKADLYLHKPIRPNLLVTALTPLVPLKAVDPDNPLGDLGGGDLGDEWLESLRNELEVDAEPQAQPPAPQPAHAPVPVATLLGFTRPLEPLSSHPLPFPKAPPIPKDAGRVELLEARVRDVETKLVAASDELERAHRELEELRRNGASFQTLFEEKHLLAMDLETRLAEAGKAAQQAARDLEQATQQEQEARERLAEKTQAAMDMMESNQLLQAQLAEAREDAERLAQAKAALESRSGELEARIGEMTSRAEALETRSAEQTYRIAQLESTRDELQSALESAGAAAEELRRQATALEESHEHQQMELLAGIDERDSRLGRMEETLNGLQEQINVLEQEKAASGARLQARAERLAEVTARLADLEVQVHQALELSKTEMN